VLFPLLVIAANLTMSARGFQAGAEKKAKVPSTTFVLAGDFSLSACFLAFSGVSPPG
jgi:hypothetical protein